MCWVPIVALLAVAGGCADGDVAVALPSAVPSSVESAVEWAEPEAYRYVLTTGCTRGFVDARYAVEVEGGRVLSATGLNEAARAHPDVAAPTLGEMDAWMREATGDVRRERDPADGRPVAFGFDPAAMAVDAGRCYRVSEYAPR